MGFLKDGPAVSWIGLIILLVAKGILLWVAYRMMPSARQPAFVESDAAPVTRPGQA